MNIHWKRFEISVFKQVNSIDVMISNWSQFKISQLNKAVNQSSPKKRRKILEIAPIVIILGILLGPVKGFSQDVGSASPDTTQENVVGTIEGESGVSTSFSEKNAFKDFINFGDYSVQEALYRIPGVQVSRDGEVNIRGTGYDNYAVSVNGLRLAPTGLGTRDVSLNALSLDGLQSVELIKVVDPTMSADALTGVVKLDSRNLVSGGNRRAISAMFGGGANTKYISRTGPGSRGWIKYAERFSEKLSISLDAGYHETFDSKEELRLQFGTQDFGNGFVDVYNQVSPAVIVDGNGRFSTSANVEFTPNSSSSYTFNAFYNTNDQTVTTHRDSWSTGGDWIDQTTTGASGEEGMFSHEAGLREAKTSQLAFSATGEYKLENVNLSYQAGWSQGSTDSRYYLFPFQIGELNYSVDISTKNRPQMEITNRETQILDDGTVDRQFLIGQDLQRTDQDHVNDQISGRFDIEFPLETGAIKAGVSSRLTFQDSEYNENEFEYNRTLRMISFNTLSEPNRNVDVINDNYRIPWFLNTQHAKAFLETQRPLFEADDIAYAYQSEVRNHSTDEHIYASYAMADLNFGAIDIKAGARVEYEVIDAEGNEVAFDTDGELAGVEIRTSSETRFNLFPYAQLGYEISEGSNIDVAYSSTIDRPDYFNQAPFLRVDNEFSLSFRGNPQLDPAKANNYDLKFSQHVNSSGVFTLAGFYKTIDNMMVRQIEDNGGLQETTFTNSTETATVYGAEVSVEQGLIFLPGIFRNLSAYANYTWSESNYQEFEDRGEMPLKGQSPHVVNAALNFEIPRFTAQVSYHWSDDLLTSIFPVNPSSGPYSDGYENGLQELSATASYQLSDRFKVWGNARQLLGAESISYLGSESAYPVSTYVDAGFDIRVGVRFDL